MRPITVTVSDGSGGAKGSDLVRFDDWAPGPVSLQVNVTGTVNYTVQTSMDDPNSPTNPVALGSMTWLSSTDTNVVSQSASKSSTFAAAPIFARVLLNSGNGSVTATFLQLSNGPI
jgi:hypothetical protein